MKYEVIIFDADETLFDFKKSERYALKNAMLEHGIKYDEGYHFTVYNEINSAIWRELEKGLIPQHKLNGERFRRLSAKLEAEFDGEIFAATYLKHLAAASFLYDDSFTLVQTLHKNFRLLIVTNGFKEVQNKRVRKSTIGQYFEGIIISEEVRVAKPDPRIFEHALGSIEYTDKSKVLMVGDSLSSDIQGGINFGIDTCWYNSKKSENNTEIKPTYEISSLKELHKILEE